MRSLSSQTKGKIERFHRYLRESFYNPLQAVRSELIDVALANREVRFWLDEVANSRIMRRSKNGRSAVRVRALGVKTVALTVRRPPTVGQDCIRVSGADAN
jgi:hypothetical protein